MTKFNRLPKEIQEKMLDYQEQQGNKRDAWVFRKDLDAHIIEGGFDWDDTPEKNRFWYDVLINKNYDLFFERYPKGTGFEPLPEKVMNVWDKEDKEKYKRVVFGRKNGKYFAWDSAGTTEEAKEINHVTIWDNAEEIPQEEAGGAEEEIEIDGKKFSKSTIKEALKNYINN
jgi:hypothetical protein